MAFEHTVHLLFPNGVRKTIVSTAEWPGIEHIAEQIATECARQGLATEEIEVEQLGPREWEAVLDNW